MNWEYSGFRPLEMVEFEPAAPDVSAAADAFLRRLQARARDLEEASQACWISEVPPTTRCKHGDADCPRCGTTTRRDAAHRTVGGKGLIARLK